MPSLIDKKEVIHMLISGNLINSVKHLYANGFSAYEIARVLSKNIIIIALILIMNR